MRQNQSINPLLLIASGLLVLVFFIHGLVGALHLRQLHNDGARWILDIIINQKFIVDYPLHRYSTFLVQIPSYLASLYLNSPRVIAQIFSVSYFTYPYLIIFAINCYFRRLDLYILTFAILSLTVVPMSSFVVSTANECSLLALLMYLSIFYDFKHRQIFLFFFALLSSFTYETAIFFQAFLIFILFNKKEYSQQIKIILLAFSISLLNWFFILLPNNSHRFFLSTLSISRVNIQFLNIILFIISMSIQIILKRNFLKFILLFSILLSSLFFQYHFLINSSYNFRDDFFNRTWVNFVVFFLISLHYFTKDNIDVYKKNFTLVAILILSLSNLYCDIQTTNYSVNIYNFTFKKLSSSSGCFTLNSEEEKYVRENMNGSYSYYPIYPVIMSPSRKINLLLNFKNFLKFPNSCNISNNSFYIFDDQWSFYLPSNKNLDFTNFKPSFEK